MHTATPAAKKATITAANDFYKKTLKFSITIYNILRNFIILYYICNEGISILENSTVMGVKTPNKIKDILLQLQSESEEKINK